LHSLKRNKKPVVESIDFKSLEKNGFKFCLQLKKSIKKKNTSYQSMQTFIEYNTTSLSEIDILPNNHFPSTASQSIPHMVSPYQNFLNGIEFSLNDSPQAYDQTKSSSFCQITESQPFEGRSMNHEMETMPDYYFQLNNKNDQNNTQPPSSGRSDVSNSKKKRKQLEKLFYNFLTSVLGKFFKNRVLQGRYNDFLIFVIGINVEDFQNELKNLKYGLVKVCKEVWSHTKFNGEWKNDFKIALTKLTQHFLESGLAEEWIENSCRNKKEYAPIYRRIVGHILEGIKRHKFYNFAMKFNVDEN